MKKLIYRFILTSILILLTLIIYFSTIGINTDRFNNLIITKVQEIDSNFDLKINDVSVKLNLFSLAIDSKTLGTDLIYNNKLVELENIKSKISLKSLINNQFALSELMISTKSIPIKDLISLLRMVKNEPKLLIAEQFVDNGYIVADLKFEFDEAGKINKNYNINGIVNNFQVSFLKKKISKLNFIFQVTEKEINLNDVSLLFNNKSIDIPELIGQKEKNGFIFSGKLKNKNLNLNEHEIKELFNNNFIKTNFKEITFNSKSNFSFKVNQKFKIENFGIKSIINVENLKINNFLGSNSSLPKMKEDITFENQKIELNYTKNKINVIGSGNVFFQDNLDKVNYKITNKKDKYIFDINLNIVENPFVVDFLSYEKDKNSSLDLNIKGIFGGKNLFFDEITFLENENILSVKNLELSKNYKISGVENIKFDYEDKLKRKNKLELKKNGINYKIIGDSFNAERLVTELLKSRKKKNQKFFDNNFKLQIDIEKIYLDQNSIIKNLQGNIVFTNSKIEELNLVSEFSKKQKMKFTIKNNNGKKVTTLFSNKAKPLVNRYKFIKGFSEGELDFYSVKENNKAQSTLKIYNFKLKELPALTKILTLASLQGIADLLSGEGIRFDEFEMNFTNSDNLMTIEEIYAIGPAISILMEGYVEKNNLISLRGTLVPATTINKTISSIPLLGDILVGKKVGEGVFGVSFKIKGPPKNLETSVNPIKTLTPRFITRTLEKIKKN